MVHEKQPFLFGSMGFLFDSIIPQNWLFFIVFWLCYALFLLLFLRFYAAFFNIFLTSQHHTSQS